LEPVRELPAPFLERDNGSVEEELKRKRAEPLGEVEGLVRRIETIKKQVSAIDQVIAIHDPAHAQNPPSKMGHKQSGQAIPIPPELKRLNKTQPIREALREAGEPLSSADGTSRIAAKHGVAADDPALPRFVTHVSAGLNSPVKRSHHTTHDPGRRPRRRHCPPRG
jgi:hypothetical protein